MITPPRRRAPRWIAAGAGLIATIVLLETITAIEGPAVCAGDESVLLEADPEVGWTYAPGLTVTVDPCGAGNAWRAPLSINRHGLPDQSWPYAKRPGEVRVLLLGNHLADGAGVARNDRLSVRLSHLADEIRGARVSAINATISGYTTTRELLWLERRGLRYSPDLVVLLLDPTRDPAASLTPPAVRSLESLPPASGLLDLSATARWMSGRAAARPRTPIAVDPPPPIESDEDRAEALRRLAKLVARMKDISQSAGAGFAIVIAPPCPLQEYPTNLCETLGEIAPCRDLGEMFTQLARDSKKPVELCLPGLERWGRDAHFVASHSLWELLAQSGLWPKSVVRGYRL